MQTYILGFHSYFQLGFSAEKNYYFSEALIFPTIFSYEQGFDGELNFNHTENFLN